MPSKNLLKAARDEFVMFWFRKAFEISRFYNRHKFSLLCVKSSLSILQATVLEKYIFRSQARLSFGLWVETLLLQPIVAPRDTVHVITADRIYFVTLPFLRSITDLFRCDITTYLDFMMNYIDYFIDVWLLKDNLNTPFE